MTTDLQLPIGTPVAAYPGTRDGRRVETRTRSLPWLIGGHTPVVMVEGLAGGIALTHIDELASDTVGTKADDELRRHALADEGGSMSDARDELVDVIAKALADKFCTHISTWNEERDGCSECLARADAALAALVDVYGEPEIYDTGKLDPTIHERRLVFPWQTVKEGNPE